MRADSVLHPFPAGRLFLTCWLVYALHWGPWVIREQFPAITLATSGTLNVERFLGWNADIFAGPRGGAFINNNPGASIAGAIPLVLARPALSALERWNETLPSSIERSRSPALENHAVIRARREWYFMAVAFLTAAGLMAPASALAVTVLAFALWSNGLPRLKAIGAGVVCGFATPIFFRTNYLNHNLLVGHLALFGALLLWDRDRRRVGGGQAALAGFLAGLAVLCDYSGIVVLATLGLYVVIRSGDGTSTLTVRLGPAALYVAGAMPPILALGAYQWWAFGYSVLPSQQFMPAIEATARGYRGFGWPSLEIAWMNFFDRRFGLFAVCPLLLLSLAAPFVSRGRFRLPAREGWLIAAFFSAFVLFCAANQYSRLQYTTGIRYLVPTIPGLVLLSLQVLQALPTVARWLILAPSFVLAWSMALHRDAYRLSWTVRMWEYGGLDHPGVLSAALVVMTGVIAFMIWRPRLSAVSSVHRLQVPKAY